MTKQFNYEAAEREANDIALQFSNSADVVGDYAYLMQMNGL